MWPAHYADRLLKWHQLRGRVQKLDLEHCLLETNRWWLTTPWTGYYLHWDDIDRWPDPWQLLQDNIFCGLARATGIIYTLGMLERSDLRDVVLAECESDNLVLIDGGKYILNWDRDTILNISPGKVNPRRRVQCSTLLEKIT